MSTRDLPDHVPINADVQLIAALVNVDLLVLDETLSGPDARTGLWSLVTDADGPQARAMCDYCDCRSHAHIAELSADHEVILHLLARVQRAIASEREHDQFHQLLDECAGPGWRRSAQLLIRSLGDHIAREESDAFPAAHQLLRPDQWDVVDAADAVAKTQGGPR